MRSFALVNIETGKAVGTKTRFKVRWDDEGAVIFEIKCDEPEEGAADPNHHVVGAKPGVDNPWYINVGRARVRPSGKTSWSFPHTGKRSYHVPERFAKMVIE